MLLKSFNLAQTLVRPRERAASYSTLLPWFGMLRDGVVLCKDGSLLVGYTFQGRDVEGRSGEEVTRDINVLETAFSTLTDRCTVHWIQERRERSRYSTGTYVSSVCQQIDEEWAQTIADNGLAEIEQSLFIEFSAPAGAEGFFDAMRDEMTSSGDGFSGVLSAFWRTISDRHPMNRVRLRTEGMIRDFESILIAFEGVLGNALAYERLTGEEFLGALYRRANFTSPNQRAVSMDDGLLYLDTLLATDAMVREDDLFAFSGDGPQRKWVAALSTTTTPRGASAPILDSLMATRGEFVVSQTFRIIPRMEAEALITKAQQHYQQEITSTIQRTVERLTGKASENPKENLGNAELARQCGEALTRFTVEQNHYGYYNLTVLAIGDTPDDAENVAERIAGSLRTSRFTVVRERLGALTALRATFPGSSSTTLRWKLLSTENLADFAPIRTISTGVASHPMIGPLRRHLGVEVSNHVRFPTRYGVPYDFSPFVRDIGHGLLIGGTGSGKTTFVTLLTAMWQKYHPCNTFILDKDYSMMMASLTMGGQHLDVAEGGGSSLGMNPVKRMISGGDFQNLAQWVSVLIEAGGASINAEEVLLLNDAIQDLARLPESHWRLSQLHASVAGASIALARKLAPYCDLSEDGERGKGPYASWFDNEEDVFSLSNFVCVECGKVLQNGAVSAPFLEYVFYCIDKMLDGVTPTFIYVEEAWHAWRNKQFFDALDNWLRTFRKKKGYVIQSTQSPMEVNAQPGMKALLQNIPTVIFMPPVNQSLMPFADEYQAVSPVSLETLEDLDVALPKRDALIIQGGDVRLVSAPMPNTILAINDATARSDARVRAKELVQSGNPHWPYILFEEFGYEI